MFLVTVTVLGYAVVERLISIVIVIPLAHCVDALGSLQTTQNGSVVVHDPCKAPNALAPI